MSRLTKDDAKYITSEIKNISYYQHKIGECRFKLEEIERQKLSISAPKSIRTDKEIIKNLNRSDPEARLLHLLEKEEQLEKRLSLYNQLYERAMQYKDQIYNDADDPEFVHDFMSKKTKWALCEKYGFSNPYDHFTRIVMDLKIAV